MTIGLLLPLSNVHPGIFKDFTDGLTAFFSDRKMMDNIILKKENVGFAGNEKEVYAKAEHLLVSQDVDVLVAYIDEKVTGMLYSLVQATGKLVIIVNPGANHPANWIGQPTVVHLTLNQAFLCWLTGTLIAGRENKDVAYVSTFYDCGYLHSADMVKNCVAKGGTIQHNYINNQKQGETFEITPLTDFLSFRPDCNNLLCVFDEAPAALFYGLLNEHQAENPLHLLVSPMMMTGKALENLGEGFNFSIEGYLPWQPGLQTESNQQMETACKRKATIFSLLGWETGLIIQEVLREFSNDFSEGEDIVNHLKNLVLHGPRGQMKLDSETGYYTTPVAKFSLPHGAGVPVIEWIDGIENKWKTFTAMQTEGVSSGWTNTYLCY